MSVTEIQAMIERVEALLAAEELSEQVETAINLLLNVVEALHEHRQSLADEVERLRKQLEQKKKAKTTKSGDDEQQKPNSDHSSEKRRKQGDKKPRKSQDRRSWTTRK